MVDSLAIGLPTAGRNLCPHVLQPAPEVLGDGDAAGIDVSASPALGDETGTFNLSLPLGAFERVPLAPALTIRRVSVVNDDGPATRRTLANVALHSLGP